MEERKFEIESGNTPLFEVVDDNKKKEPEKNPRFRQIGTYNVCNHPNYQPSPIFRDMKWHLEYDKQAKKYPKIFKPRSEMIEL